MPEKPQTKYYEYDVWSRGPRKISPRKIKTTHPLSKSDEGKEFSCKDKQGNLIAFVIKNFYYGEYGKSGKWIEVESRRFKDQQRVKAISWR